MTVSPVSTTVPVVGAGPGSSRTAVGESVSRATCGAGASAAALITRRRVVTSRGRVAWATGWRPGRRAIIWIVAPGPGRAAVGTRLRGPTGGLTGAELFRTNLVGARPSRGIMGRPDGPRIESAIALVGAGAGASDRPK